MNDTITNTRGFTPAIKQRSSTINSSMRGLATGRRVALLTVHHVEVGGINYTGGAEKYILSTLEALLASGASVHVGYSGTSIYEELLESASPKRLTVERTNWLDESLSGDARLKFGVIRERRRWLRATGADTLLVVQQAGGGAFGASIVAAKTLGVRTVMAVRQQPQPLPGERKRRMLGLVPSLQLWRRRLIWRRQIPALCSDSIIFNSRIVATEYADEYGWPVGRFCVIPNGERLRESDRPQRMVREIGAVGRVTEAKGADTLLEAFARLAGDYPGIRLTYFGDGPLIPALQSRAAVLGLSNRVRFAGYEPKREKIYGEMDVCAQLSRRESMSNSVLEAMAHGLPCVVSDVGGLPELVMDGLTGFVVSPGDPDSAASAIRRLLEDPALAMRMGQGGSIRIREQFDLDSLMETTVRTILQI